MNYTEELKKHIEKKFNCKRLIEDKVFIKEGKLYCEADPLFLLSEIEEIYFVAIGKAGFSMFDAFSKIITPKDSIIVNPSLENPEKNIIKSTHPQITSKSFEAGKKIVEFLRKPRKNDLVIFLVSGGASALVEYSIFSPEIIYELNKELLRSDLDINKINQIRQSVSLLKRGGLLNFTVSNTLSFIISDIPGGMFENVGSGPTVTVCKGDDYYKKCEDIIKNISIKPEYKEKIFNFYNIRKKIKCKNKQTRVVEFFQPRDILSEVNSFFKKKGFKVTGNIIDYNSELKELLQLCKNKISNLKEREVVVINGEVLYQIKESGSGGRVTHFCLKTMPFLHKGMFVGGLATDGVDGLTPQPVAGVFYLKKDNKIEIPDKKYNFDSYSYFLSNNSLVSGGYSGINLCDIYFFGKT